MFSLEDIEVEARSKIEKIVLSISKTLGLTVLSVIL